MKDDLRTVDALRNDCLRVTGTGFTHFLCPILLTDEPGTLCRGHVVPNQFKSSSATVWQRTDVDNFFGTIAEADFVAAVKNRAKHSEDFLLDPELQKRYRPKLTVNGANIGYYFNPPESHSPAHTKTRFIDRHGRFHDVVFKVSKDEMAHLEVASINFDFERDSTGAIIVSLVKAAHLTLFRLFGYKHVFQCGGQLLSSLLRDLFHAAEGKDREAVMAMVSRFEHRLGSMAVPIKQSGEGALRGTIEDRKVLACQGASGAFFAIGVIVRTLDDMFCVFTPSNPESIDTFVSFVNERPPEIAVHVMHLCEEDGEAEPHWEYANGPPLRIRFM